MIYKDNYFESTAKAKRAFKSARLKRKRFAPLDASRDIPVGLTWYAIAVAPRKEFQVTHWLEGRGWFTLCPVREFEKRRSCSKRSGRNEIKEIIQIPELGGVIFAGFHGPANWLQLETCHHARGPLSCNGTPLAIPAPQVVRFQLEATENALRLKSAVLAGHTRNRLRDGGRARVISGPFQGRDLDVTKITGKWAEVVQSWFGGASSVKVLVADLEAA